jgi:hypothetical protein
MDPLQHKHRALNHRLSQPRTQGSSSISTFKKNFSLTIFELSLAQFFNIFHIYVVYACLPCKFVYLVQDLSENHFVRKLPENKY